MFKLTQRPQTMMTVKQLPTVYFCQMFPHDEWFILPGGFKMVNELVEFNLAHPIRIIRMRIKLTNR